MQKWMIIPTVMLLATQAHAYESMPSEPQTPASPYQDALISAVNSNQPDQVRQLLKDGANPNSTDIYGVPVLTNAALHGYLGVVRALVEARADTNTMGNVKTFYPPLVVATPFPMVVTYLLEHGADPNLKLNDKIVDKVPTPFFYFIRHGICSLDSQHGSSIQALNAYLAHGADIKMTDSKGRNSLFSLGCGDAVLDDYSSLETRKADEPRDADEFGNEADPEQYRLAVRALVKAGADITLVSKEGFTPLGDRLSSNYKVTRNFSSTIRTLLENGANPNDPVTDPTRSPLFLFVRGALCKDHPGAAEIRTGLDLLISHEADLKAVDDDGKGILFGPSCWNGYSYNAADPDIYMSTMNTLIRRGAPVNERAPDGKTPLLSQIDSDSSSLETEVRFLVSRGAKLNAVDNDGANALMLAAKYDDEAPTFEYLLRSGLFKVNARDKDQMTAVMYAASHANVNAIVALQEHGACFNLVDHDGDTALSDAIRSGGADTVRLIRHYMSEGTSQACKDLSPLL